MKKPESLRQALNKSVPFIANNPECLSIFIDSGSVVSTLATSLSFEYRYTLNVIVMNFAGDQNLLMAPILGWLTQHQPDILANPERREDGFTFEADILNNTTSDISIDLKLTERVIIKEENGQMVVEAVDEPNPADPDEWGWK
ncbi:phage tail protein [Hafnia paralvei]|uniref:phage tail protein n=1 Tax=Hafnia paralvei TaxID=546367 RepID=UPI003CECCA97